MKKWWKEAIAYQIYPRSFIDSNGDGIGDLKGIITKLDYLKELGIDVIWLSPMYKSPNDDNGYDISDYHDVMDEFGTIDDFDELLEEVHRRGMKLILDLVVNHTSDEHPWFIESRSRIDNPKRDYYIWSDGKNGAEPNNWESIFGGSIWELDERSGQYYMHIFSKKQPDLNWENPVVRSEIYNMINWWLDKGIDGYRIDAISHVKKVPGFPDMPNPMNLAYVPSLEGHINREGIHEFLDELKRETFSKYDIMTVGEAGGVSVEQAEDWVGETKGKLNMIFQFEINGLWEKGVGGGLDIYKFKKILTKWQKGLEGKGWNALFMENHDLPRSVSTWGDDKAYRVQSAKALATMFFMMQGTPFIYQGQEIGMTNVKFESIDDYNDITAKNLYRMDMENGKTHEEIMPVIWKNGRDNSRTPMQWDEGENAGFTTGTPWLKVNGNYNQINVRESLKNPDSIYYYYKKLILLRKERSVAVYGTYDLLLPRHNKIYSYTRTLGEERLLVIVNLFAEETIFQLPRGVKYSSAELLLANYETEAGASASVRKVALRPYEARIYELKG
ncbi:alpha-glucosidase [Paenibacillus sp. BR2-3]|uniref:glycoside hydrolase family 13 protein n=1 Tax=Paenibacillus sp. BR2-3 TaxID=3048494 RepID=UPI003977C15D